MSVGGGGGAGSVQPRRSTLTGSKGASGAMPEYQSMKSKARALFDKYDTDGSGCISILEFRKLCYDMGYFLTEKELELDVQILDVDGDGEISYEECKTLVYKPLSLIFL